MAKEEQLVVRASRDAGERQSCALRAAREGGGGVRTVGQLEIGRHSPCDPGVGPAGTQRPLYVRPAEGAEDCWHGL